MRQFRNVIAGVFSPSDPNFIFHFSNIARIAIGIDEAAGRLAYHIGGAPPPPGKALSCLPVVLDSSYRVPTEGIRFYQMPSDLHIRTPSLPPQPTASGSRLTEAFSTGNPARSRLVLRRPRSPIPPSRSRCSRGGSEERPPIFRQEEINFEARPIREQVGSPRRPPVDEQPAASRSTGKGHYFSPSPAPRSAKKKSIPPPPSPHDSSDGDDLVDDVYFPLPGAKKPRLFAKPMEASVDSKASPFANAIECVHPKLNGKRIYLVASLEMSSPSRKTFVGHIKQMGADVYDTQAPDPSWEGDRDASDTVPGTALSAADFVICDSCSGWEFWLAWESEKSIGTFQWITALLNITNPLHCRIQSPLARLFDYPIPPGMISGWDPSKNVVSITNYTGFSRAWLIRLIEKMGLKYSGPLDCSTSLLLAANKSGKKVEWASELGIPTVNHLYLEDCFRSWSKLEVKLIHTSYPKDGDLLQPTYNSGYTIETIQRWSQTSAAKEERKSVLQEYHWSCNINAAHNKFESHSLQEVTITDESDHINPDDHTKPLSNLAMSEKPVPKNNTKLKKAALRDTSDDQSRNRLPSPLTSGAFTSAHEFPKENGHFKSGENDGEAHRPRKDLRVGLEHLRKERSSNKTDKMNAKGPSLDDISKMNASKAVASTPKWVNSKDTSHQSRTSHAQKAHQ
ncbi:uncharacterized protein MELLADRAFT_90918 [Melampsora larici-populina 98AG31]|uniref:BRCT domain-containing protein n=1 Tax=Melampsora larici-populina (strain 98AG31 / pathotype 3-4-7) TaxID=747676 RepID=F4R813_MELLP|nr:uncharacterized protein MELLADRAFT_90918 [Melampsora larici-populina 98AG31]EGG11694.1 hypothetical protein MELLADRAFT_90918 [Melampsora larici-populina 98AG31]